MSTKSAYNKAFDVWVEAQKNQIKQIELNIKNSENMIAIHSEALDIHKKALNAEKELLDSAIADQELSES